MAVKSWIDQKCEESWRFRWTMRWYRFSYFIMWLKNELVWDFNKYPEGRLMFYRTKEFLPENDPRHFQE